MLQSIMTSRGQITIPAEIREKLQLNSGNKFEFSLQDGNVLMMPINKSINTLKGILPKPKIALSCDQIKKIIKNRKISKT